MNRKLLFPFISLILLVLTSCLDDDSGTYLVVVNNTSYDVVVSANDSQLGIVEANADEKFEMEIGSYYLFAQENVPGSTNIHQNAYTFYSGSTFVWTLNE